MAGEVVQQFLFGMDDRFAILAPAHRNQLDAGSQGEFAPQILDDSRNSADAGVGAGQVNEKIDVHRAAAALLGSRRLDQAAAPLA